MRGHVTGACLRTWRLDALSGLVLAGIPLEALAFALAFGMYWSGAYEHFTWRRDATVTGIA